MWSRNGKVWNSEFKNVESKISQNVYIVQGSEVRQPFGLFSMTFHDFPGSVRTLLTVRTEHNCAWPQLFGLELYLFAQAGPFQQQISRPGRVH